MESQDQQSNANSAKQEQVIFTLEDALNAIKKNGIAGITNRIINADCIEVMKGIPDKAVDLVLTDPPYIVGAKGRGLAGDRQYLKDITSEELDRNFDLKNLEEFLRVLKTPNIIIFSSKDQIYQYISFAKQNDLNWQLITWHKTNPTPLTNNNYLPDTEYIFHIWKDKKLGGNYHTKQKYYLTQVEKYGLDHPTVKPIGIINNLIKNGASDDEIVLDPFLGSGTTAVACKELGRKFIGIEINPKYCEIAQRRLAQEYLFT